MCDLLSRCNDILIVHITVNNSFSKIQELEDTISRVQEYFHQIREYKKQATERGDTDADAASDDGINRGERSKGERRTRTRTAKQERKPRQIRTLSLTLVCQ